ncbi:hypothetical protein [Hanstruepera neustonica]|uniref:hypothetical protein n=1 Tax=Hanstruepera neustonica TaxID=1445657 RepID=UPI001FB03977|nr:hypothetical protein [Hanstruepera neustonica]
MKKAVLNGVMLIFGLSIILTSCSSDDDGGNIIPNNNVVIQQVVTQAQSGTWRITSFIDSGQDETNNFTGYNFTFGTNGALSASNGNNSESGNWSVTDSNSNDDSNDDIDFNIMFNVPDTNDFEDLNDDWDIVSHTDNRIQLRDISGGNGGTDTLTFERN